MRKFAKKAGDILFYALLILFLFVIASRALHPDDPIKVFGYTPTVVMSESMLPTLQVYSYNMVKDVDIEDVAVGDIIVYRNESRGMNIIHRVYELEDVDGVRTLRTWGDNNPVPDTMETTEENFLGKVTLTMNWPAYLIQAIFGADFRMSEQLAPLVVGILVTLCIVCVPLLLYLAVLLILRACGVKRKPEEEETTETIEGAE